MRFHTAQNGFRERQVEEFGDEAVRGASKLHRFYAVIVTDRGSLSSLLVQNGLAHVFDVPTALSDWIKAATYVERLKGYEAKAEAKKRGGWK